MLEKRFRQATVARSTLVERALALGKRPFHAAPFRLLFLVLNGPLALTGGLEHLMVALGPDHQGARFGVGSGASCTLRTGLPSCLAKRIWITS